MTDNEAFVYFDDRHHLRILKREDIFGCRRFGDEAAVVIRNDRRYPPMERILIQEQDADRFLSWLGWDSPPMFRTPRHNKLRLNRKRRLIRFLQQRGVRVPDCYLTQV